MAGGEPLAWLERPLCNNTYGSFGSLLTLPRAS